MRLRALVLLLAASTLTAPPSAAQESGTPPPVTLQQGQGLLSQGDAAGAARIFEALVEKDDTNATAWFLLGYARHTLGDYAGALVAHEKAAEFPANKANASYNAACAHARMGQADAAFTWLEQAVAAGFRDRAQLETDPDLESLREDPRFAGLVPEFLDGPALFEERPRVLHTFEGEAAGDQFGWVARNVGDLDADGVDDFATSAPTKALGGPSAGRVYVYSSKQGRLLFTRDGQPGEGLGTGISAAGDVNGDGTPDVIAGAPAGGDVPGAAYVYSGIDGATLLTLRAGEAGDAFGQQVCDLGDLDGDGHDDVMVGAPGCDAAGVDAGRATVHSGADGRVLATLDGHEPGESFGSAVDASRDPRHRLLVVAAMGAAGRTGRIHVSRWVDGAVEPFFRIDPDATAGNLGQYFVSIPGDVDADGVPDVYASDWGNRGGGVHAGRGSGRVYVHSGRDGRRLLTITGSRPGENFGTSPSDVGDVDGDGHADLLVGAWQNEEEAPAAGSAYLHSGKDGALLATYTCRQAQDTFGFDATGLNDVDGDGIRDLLLTSAWSQVYGPQTGRVFILAGPALRGEGER